MADDRSQLKGGVLDGASPSLELSLFSFNCKLVSLLLVIVPKDKGLDSETAWLSILKKRK